MRIGSPPPRMWTVGRPLATGIRPSSGVDRFVSASPPATPLPTKPARSLATVLQSHIERARAEGSPPNIVLNSIRASYPRNVGIALGERVGDFGSAVPDRILEALAVALHSDPPAAAEIVSSWRIFRYGPVLLTDSDYGRTTAWVRDQIRKRLSPVITVLTAERLLRNGPPPILEIFHNMVFGTSRDEPPIGVPSLAQKLYGEFNERLSSMIFKWERMWSDIAQRLGWETKTRIHPDFYDIHSATRYAKQKGWELEQFRGWLNKKVREVPEIAYLLELFDTIIDLGHSPPENPAFSERVYYNWVRTFYNLAVALGAEEKIRPRAKTLIAHARRRKAIRDLDAIFAEAAGSPPEERASVLHDRLVKAGLPDYAEVAANMVQAPKGEGEVRLPVTHLNAGEFTCRRLAQAGQDMEPLATKYGFALKKKPEISHRRGSSRNLGKRFKELLEQTEAPSPEKFLAHLQADQEVKDLMGERHAPFVELFQIWIGFYRDDSSVPKTTLYRKLSERTGISLFTVDGWWRIFERWRQEQRWFTQT